MVTDRRWFPQPLPLYWCLPGVRTTGVNACPGAYGRAARRLHTPCSIYLIPTGNGLRPSKAQPVGVVVFILFRPETHCVLVLRTHPVGVVVFSPSMIAGLWANDEPLAHARLGSDCQQASRV